MSDKEFDELVDAMKTHHNPPPVVPRDRMWDRIEAARSAELPARRRRWNGWQIGLATAAVLVLGIALGRLSERPDTAQMVADTGSSSPAEATVPVTVAPRDEATALVRHAATNLFNRANVQLTDLKISSCADPGRAPVPAWAGGMLSQTRLLLDSPLARDAEMKTLLLDLELVLARIAGLSSEDCTRDVDRIRRDLDDNATLDRLRHAAAGSKAQRPI